MEVIRVWLNVQTVLKIPTVFIKRKQMILELKLWFVNIMKKMVNNDI